MSIDGGSAIAGVLAARGVRFLFTLCGGHIAPILVGARRAGIRVIDVRDEATAVFAADAVARLTGVPGVAAVTAGPGVANTVTALKNAHLAQSPLVLLGGAAATVLRGRGSLQDIDQAALVGSCVKKVLRVKRACDLAPVLEHAFDLALSGVPGPVFVECPIDLLYDEALVRRWYGIKSDTPGGGGLRARTLRWYLNRHVDRMFACAPQVSAGDQVPSASVSGASVRAVRSAARLIRRAERPLMIVGSQAMLRTEGVPALTRAIETIGVPVFLTGMARGLLGREHPLLARHRRREALAESDLVVLAGMPCDFRLNYGRDVNARAKLIGVNRGRADLYLNRRPDLAAHADPLLFLSSLAATLPGRNRSVPEWIARLSARDREREDEIGRMAAEESEAINPLGLLRLIDTALGDDDIVIVDGGDFASSAAYIVRPAGPLSWLDPGVFGTLGVGAGFALGAKLARPGSRVWILYGDGAAGYSLQEFDTFVRHGLPVIAVVGNDAAWTQIARDQVEYLRDDTGTVLRRTDYHAVAEGFGGRGILIRSREEIESALAEARRLAGEGHPVLINALIGATDFRKGSISM